jgi:hypothetical protein
VEEQHSLVNGKLDRGPSNRRAETDSATHNAAANEKDQGETTYLSKQCLARILKRSLAGGYTPPGAFAPIGD